MKFVVINGTYHKVQCSNLNVQWIKIISVISEIRSWYYFAIMIRKIRSMYSNFFYILVNERVGERKKMCYFGVFVSILFSISCDDMFLKVLIKVPKGR